MKVGVIFLFISVVLIMASCNKLSGDFSRPKEKAEIISNQKLLQEDYNLPLIESYTFGSIKIEGKTYGDIKLFENKVIAWKYIKHHTVTVEDVQEIVEGIDYLVIGTGAEGRVEVEAAVLDFLVKKNIQVKIEETAEAVKEYNSLVKENKKVAAILHSTC